MRHRRAVLLGSLALSVLSLLSLRTLRLDIDVLSTLPSGRAAFDDFSEYLKTFGGTQTLLVLIDRRESPASGGASEVGADRAGGSSARTDAETAVRDVPALKHAVDLLAERYRALPEITSVTAGVDPAGMKVYLDPVNAPALVPAESFGELAARLDPDTIAASVTRVKGMLSLPIGADLLEQVRRDPLFLGTIAGAAIRDRYADPFAGRAETYLLSPNRDAALILLSPAGSPFDAQFTERLFVALREAEAGARDADPAVARLRIRHGGAYAHAHEDAHLVKGDVIRYVLLTLIAVIAIFQIFYRTPMMLPLIGYLLVAGSLLAFATSVLFLHQLNALSLCFAAIFYGLAIDSGIHFYSRLLIERQTAPLEEAIVRTCDGIGAANIVAEVTTAAAFTVIALSAIGAVREIGALSAVGMMVNIAHTFVLLPAMTVSVAARLDRRPPRPQDAPWLAEIAGWSARHTYLITTVSLAAALGWVVLSPTVPVDADINHLRPTGVESTETEEAVEAHFGALAPRGIAIVRGPDLDAALEREESVVEWLQAHRVRPHGGAASDELISGYQALSTFLPSRATERARRAAFAALPLERARGTLHAELVRQGFRVSAFADAERALGESDATLPRPTDDLAGNDVATSERAGGGTLLAPLLRRHVGNGVMRGPSESARSIAVDGSDASRAVLIAIPFQPADGVALGDIRERIRSDLDPSIVVTGAALMQAALADVIAREVILFTLLTIVLNLLIVLPQARSWRLALIVMAPTIVIVGALVTGMHLSGVAFTPLNLIVLPLTLGIGVDNCVYLVARVREGWSIENATRLTGRAIAVTTLTTMAGFGFLSVSRYPGLAGLGWLAALAIGLTFIAAVVLQPAFLALEGRTVAESAALEPATSEGVR